MEFRDYLTFLQELCRELDTLRGVEQQKIAAIQAGNLEALDACMKQEQAAALSLRGREQHRQKMLQALELDGVSLADLPHRCPPQDKEQATMTQRPDVIIKYVGGPLYVPPSADPDYEPVDINV